MTEDSILIRAERLIRGDIVLWADATWRVCMAEKTSTTELELVMECVSYDHPDLRTTVGQDRKLRVLLLI